MAGCDDKIFAGVSGESSRVCVRHLDNEVVRRCARPSKGTAETVRRFGCLKRRLNATGNVDAEEIKRAGRARGKGQAGQRSTEAQAQKEEVIRARSDAPSIAS